jgi:pimeloyl-ACP methyl ester carboxylesterase
LFFLSQDWLDIVVQFRQHHPNEAVDFLLIDYPGFGGNQGNPHPDTILSGSRAALDALAASLQQSPSSIHSRLHLLGHSLGCAASLQLAADLWAADSSGEHAHRIVLSAPFTSLEGMVRVMFGRLPGLSSLLQHPFDNIDRVDALLSDSKAHVQFFIQHGDRDEIVPVSMGRALSDRIRQRGGQVIYREVPGGDHNSLIYHEMHALFAAMLKQPSAL